MEPFLDRKLRYNKEYRRFIDKLGPVGLGHPIGRELGLRARLHFAGLGARDLPPPAPTTGSVTLLGADLEESEPSSRLFQGRFLHP